MRVRKEAMPSHWSRKGARKEKQHPARGVGSRVRCGWSEVAWCGHCCIASDMRRRWQTGRQPLIAIRVAGKAVAVLLGWEPGKEPFAEVDVRRDNDAIGCGHPDVVGS
eukprot:923013-Pleurochrysis_carterae.AAC.1